MAIQKSTMQGFTSSWQKTAAWAQSQGISKNSYYPIYQMDSARLLQGESPMSEAERTRAILAASNPNNVTHVSSDKPNPTNVMGNTVNDLRSIFTGLAPNHLVSNIYDTVKNTVVHPETFIKPIVDVAGGLTSGNIGEVKQGLELGAGLSGPGSILSWLPGVYVAGEIAQGGIGEALSHPVVSLLDVAPFAPAGKILTAGADASRMATMAQRMGYSSVDDLRNASLPGMAKQFIMSRKTADTPFLNKISKGLLDPKTGQPLSIGDALDRWITTNTGMGKTLSGLMKGMVNINQHQTDAELALFRPAEMAIQRLKPEQQQEVMGLVNQTDPRAKGRTPAAISTDDQIDPNVRTAYTEYNRVRDFIADEALASEANVVKPRPDGTLGIYGSAGRPSPVIAAHDELRDAQDELVAAMEPNHKIVNQIQSLDAAGHGLTAEFSQTWVAAQRAAAQLDGTDRYHGVTIDESKQGTPRKITLDLRRQAEALFGKEDPVAGTRDEGLAGQLQMAINNGDWAAAKKFSEIMGRRLSGSGPKSLDPELHPAFGALKAQVNVINKWATKRVKLDTDFRARLGDYAKKKGGPGYGAIREPLRKYLSAQRKYAKTVYDNPTSDWLDVVKQKFTDNLLAEEDRYHRMEGFSKVLKDSGWGDKQIEALHHDPTKMAQLLLLHAEALAGSPTMNDLLTKDDVDRLWKAGVDAANALRPQGHEVVYIPSVSTLDLRDTDPGLYGIHLSSTGRAKKSSQAFERTKSVTTAERSDVVAALHVAGKEQLQIDGTIEYAEHVLSPHLMDGDAAYNTIMKTSGLQDEYLRHIQAGSSPRDAINVIMRDNFDMVKFNANDFFGFSLPRWNAGDQYIPRGIAQALPKMLDKGQFPLDGVYSKATNLFRFSILGLSPRYTAHVVFGGTFLLALRSSPHVIAALPEAWRTMRDTGEVPRGTFDGASQRGIDPVVYQTFHDSIRNKGSRVFHQRTGADMARLVAEENIEKSQGIKLAAAQPVHWLKAVADTNYKFTNWASAFQRSVAYWDHYGKNVNKFKDPVTGELTTMSKARLEHEAMEHTYKVLGDLKAMTPLERGVFTNIFPFYGWTKHILQYTLSYPADHPFRAATLAVLAEQNTDAVASGLPARLQFLMFLGSPDVQGNVNAVDVRALDPLRDVANYATLGGWISSLNPVITAPLAMIDPQIIYGGNPLYPNVTYDQFYGIETAGAQGSPLTAAEQFVPQISALDSALNLSGQYRNLAATNPNQFAKDIFGALNVPFAQVQHINLKQIAAKDEIDRYHVTSAAAQNAFNTGNFSAIANLGSVPDPQNPDYEAAPSYLSQLYKQLQEQYPGQAPSETATPPPPLTL